MLENTIIITVLLRTEAQICYYKKIKQELFFVWIFLCQWRVKKNVFNNWRVTTK